MLIIKTGNLSSIQSVAQKKIIHSIFYVVPASPSIFI